VCIVELHATENTIRSVCIVEPPPTENTTTRSVCTVELPATENTTKRSVCIVELLPTVDNIKILSVAQKCFYGEFIWPETT
jgi:hypothetical protein